MNVFPLGSRCAPEMKLEKKLPWSENDQMGSRAGLTNDFPQLPAAGLHFPILELLIQSAALERQ